MRTLPASGVLVLRDGFIVTNAHVVGKCRKMTANLQRKRQLYSRCLTSQCSNTTMSKVTQPCSRSQGKVSTSLVSCGSPNRRTCFYHRNPQGFEQSISEGIVSGDREMDGASWIQHQLRSHREQWWRLDKRAGNCWASIRGLEESPRISTSRFPLPRWRVLHYERAKPHRIFGVPAEC